MNRTELLNYLIRQRNAIRYLEIGMHAEQNNFAHIGCEHKVMLSPGNSADFFTYNTKKFDLIFIDGLHTAAAVMDDFTHASACLAEGGMIVLHDCMPPDEWHQRAPEDYRPGENWNGTVWQAALRIFHSVPYECTLLDMDWGCGLIDTAIPRPPVDGPLPEDLHYSLHYPWLLEYKTSPAAYIRRQVKVFYHLACMNNWQQVFTEQMTQLHDNGFFSLNLTILGKEDDWLTTRSIADGLNIQLHPIFRSQEFSHFETPAFTAIEKYVQDHAGYVLYLHSKGVSNPADATKAKWRRLMMSELVVNWQQCMLLLPEHDLVGVNWRHMPPTSHFCGNFWYASTAYLRKLEDFRLYYDNPRFQIGDHIDNRRLGCEFWISSGRETPRLVSLNCQNVDFCNREYWRAR